MDDVPVVPREVMALSGAPLFGIGVVAVDALRDAAAAPVVFIAHAHRAVRQRERGHGREPVLRVVGVGEAPVVGEPSVRGVGQFARRQGGAEDGDALVEAVRHEGVGLRVRAAEDMVPDLVVGMREDVA